jgi:hypothetical protein
MPRRGLAIITAVVALNAGAYLLVNHYRLRPPVELPLTRLDRVIPFLPWTVWPYVILLALDVVLPMSLRTRVVFRDTLVGYGIAMALNFSIWIIFPTVYPRPAFSGEPSVTTAAYNVLVAVDSPSCCFPSGHITIPVVAAWGVGREYPHLRGPLAIMLGLLATTVLTTKQHYLVDIPSGLATAAIGIAFARSRLGAGKAKEV